MQEIKPETVCHIIFRARQMNAGEDLVEPGDEPEADLERLMEEAEQESSVHDEHEHDPIYLELKSYINELTADEQCELIALAWLGRGDSDSGWDELMELAQERRSTHTAEYLLDMPLLGDFLEEALSQFDISVEDFENESR
jgi:hypothetical protein